MAHQEKGLAPDLNKTHMVGEKKLLKAVLGPAPAFCHVHYALAQVHMEEGRKDRKKIKVIV